MEIALGTPEWYSKVMYVKWKLVLVRFEIVLVLGVRLVHGLRRMYHVHGNRFGHTRMVLLGNVCRVETCFSPF